MSILAGLYPEITVSNNLNILQALKSDAIVLDSRVEINRLLRKVARIYQLDFKSPFCAWNIAEILLALYLKGKGLNSNEVESDSKKRIEAFLSKSKKSENVFVLGTGPSISTVQLSEFKSFKSIVCNTFVKSPSAFEALQPDILTATDISVYLGDSLTSRLFFFYLNQRMREHDFLFVYPLKAHPIVLNEVDAAFHDRLVPINTGTTVGFETLVTEFKLNALGNTFNTAMMPLAAYMGKNITLAGFDGSGQRMVWGKSSTIWLHNEEFSFSPFTLDLDRTEAAFQKHHKDLGLNNKYESEYFGDAMETQIAKLELAGYTIKSLTPSNHPALQIRMI